MAPRLTGSPGRQRRYQSPQAERGLLSDSSRGTLRQPSWGLPPFSARSRRHTLVFLLGELPGARWALTGVRGPGQDLSEATSSERRWGPCGHHPACFRAPTVRAARVHAQGSPRATPQAGHGCGGWRLQGTPGHRQGQRLAWHTCRLREATWFFRSSRPGQGTGASADTPRRLWLGVPLPGAQTTVSRRRNVLCR